MRLVWGVVSAVFLLILSVPATAAGQSPTPSCAVGPTTVDGMIQGTPCDDRIIAPASVQRVNGGGGDDTILAGPISAAVPCAAVCLAGEPGCGAETRDMTIGIEDLEGSEAADALYGDAGPNQLLGHKGADVHSAGAGADTILANSADSDPVINCGADIDTAVIDIPTSEYADATPVGCETVRQGAPNDFRALTQLPPPPLVSNPASDRKAPRTRLTAHPAKRLTTTRMRRRVVFGFKSDERGSHFRCKLDRKPYRPCISPRAYNLKLGRHAVRILAIDAAGNADSTPALFRFRIHRLPVRTSP